VLNLDSYFRGHGGIHDCLLDFAGYLLQLSAVGRVQRLQQAPDSGRDFGLFYEIVIGMGGYDEASRYRYVGVSHFSQVGPFAADTGDIIFVNLAEPGNNLFTFIHGTSSCLLLGIYNTP